MSWNEFYFLAFVGMDMDSQSAHASAKHLNIFKLIMIIVVAMDSIKNLAVNAQYGSSLLVYYLVAILTFFIPSALVTAELATAWPETGGAYIWVRAAFSSRVAFLIIWVQWIFAIIWYPTILSFVAAMLAYLINPAWAESKAYIVVSILVLFWIGTLLNCLGLKLSSFISSFCAVIGVIVPMILITVLGIAWLYLGKPVHIDFSWQMTNVMGVDADKLRLYITLLYSLMGIEMVAAYAGDANNPQQDYPRALVFASIIIILTVVPASLTLAMVLPKDNISLTTGVIDGFSLLLDAVHCSWLKPIFILCVSIGSFGIFFVWLLTMCKYLLLAAEDRCLPRFLQKTNQNKAPINLLLVQGVIFTLFCGFFILMPSVNSAFWFFTVSASQMALVYYLLLFASALRLRQKKPHLDRPFRVGKHPLVLWGICLVAMLTCFISVGFGFIPPPEIEESNIVFYEVYLVSLMLGCLIMGMFIHRSSTTRHRAYA